MPSSYTSNYHLSQWEAEDQVLRTDFNADNRAIEDALTSLAAAGAAETDARTAAVSSLNTALSKKGTCSIGTFTYKGTGTYGADGPTKIKFPRKPTAFIVFSSSGILFGFGSENEVIVLMSTETAGTVRNATLTATWSGNTCSFYSTSEKYQMNRSVTTYRVLALYTES